MRAFQGRGGTVSYLGESHNFVRLPLLDLNEGWDWRAPDGMSYWQEDQKLTAEYWERGWNSIEPFQVFHLTGHISLSRSVQHVVVSGTCVTSSVECESESWQLSVPMVVKNRNVMGDENTRSVAGRSPDRCTAILSGAVCQEMQNALIRLPVSRGVLIGIGSVKPISTGIEVTFNSEGVRYGPC